jgi:hypothetical protein
MLTTHCEAARAVGIAGRRRAPNHVAGTEASGTGQPATSATSRPLEGDQRPTASGWCAGRSSGPARAQDRPVYIFAVPSLKRQFQPRPKGVVELLGVALVRSAAPIDRCPESDEALRRYRDARRARQNQAELADQFAGEYVEVLGGASSQELHAAAVVVAEAYEEARSLAQIELDLMVAAKVTRVSDRTERQMDIQDSSVGDEILGVPGDYVQAAAHWRNVAETERVSVGETPGATDGRADTVQPWPTTPNWATSSTTSLRRAAVERVERRGTAL